MKKVYSMAVLLAVMAIAYTACVEKGDFDTDKISLSDLRPTYLVPLIQDTIRLDDNEHVDFDGDTTVFVYNIDNVAFPSRNDWFTIPDITQSIASDNITFPSLGNVPIDVSFTKPVNMVFEQVGQYLDSATFASLNMEIEFDQPNPFPNSFDTLEISSPQILVDGEPFKYTDASRVKNANPDIRRTHPIVIPRPCKIMPDDGQITFTIRLKGNITLSSTTIVLSATVKITGMQNSYTGLFGYFGQIQSTLDESVELSFFDDLNITADKLEFASMKIATNIQNSLGIPFRLLLDRIEAYDKDDAFLAAEENLGAINVYAPSYQDQNKTMVSRDTIWGQNLGRLISLDTRKVVFKFTVLSNPDGTGKNYITNMGTVRTVGTGIRIPWKMTANQLRLKDTVDINLSSVSIDELALRALIKNKMPATIKMQVNLLDEYANSLEPPLFAQPLTLHSPPLAAGIATETSTLDTTFSISAAVLQNMKDSKRALISFDVDTGPDNVLFLDESTISLKIGAKATFNYDDLLD